MRRIILAAAAVGILIGVGASTGVIQRLLRPAPPLPEFLGDPAVNEAGPPGPAPEGMVWIPGGIFWMGSEGFQDAQPIHKVYVDGFWMDKTEVTNEQFAKFVAATGYVTVVERWPNPATLKGFHPEVFGLQPEYLAHLGLNHGAAFPAGMSWLGLCSTQSLLKPYSLVFSQPSREISPFKNDPRLWWRTVAWANWKNPEGPGSDIKGREQHPVVHICYEDAVAYCKWAGGRLPTEAEWEFAFRGGLDRKKFAWGDSFMLDGKPVANTWQGEFPHRNTMEDGFARTAPVGSFPANGFGLHDMAGNVWEWCADWYQPKYQTRPLRNPTGPESSHDPTEPGVPKRVQRGGSFLCCDNYCVRFMAGGRGKGDADSTASHIGFRCVRTP